MFFDTSFFVLYLSSLARCKDFVQSLVDGVQTDSMTKLRKQTVENCDLGL